MNVEELQRLIDEETFPYELNPEWEVVTNVKVVDAARLVANPNIVEVMAKAMFDAQPSGVEWEQASEEARNFWRIFAKAAVAAALTPGDTEQ